MFKMEVIWIPLAISFISIVAGIKLLTFFRSFKTANKTSLKLPPGPTPLPFLGNLLLLRKYPSKFFTLLHDLHSEYGPIFTLYFGSRPVIFIAGHFLAHQALILNGAALADRPPALTTTKVLYSNHITIFTAFHGPNWNLLRRNLVFEILHPSRLRLLSGERKLSLNLMKNSLEFHSQSGAVVCFLDHFWPAMMGLSVFMCFGFNLDENKIKDLAHLLHRVLVLSSSQNKLNGYPVKVGKILFPKLWREISMLRKEVEDSILPLVKARYEEKRNEIDHQKNKEEHVLPYVDTLMDLQLPEENRKLEEGEIISLCAEFLNGIVHTTVVVMQWAMANIVKYPEVQEKLYAEICGVMEASKEQVTEDDVNKMPYLKAVILETLRRHPPGHLTVPHFTTEEVVLDERFIIPKKVTVHFMTSSMAWDAEVWEEPMKFQPERFLAGGDEDLTETLTGNKEIKMMPFGGGRRICPGIAVSMLHLQYFVANLVWLFKWDSVGEVDMAEKLEVSITMKTPLEALVSARSKEG